MRFTHHLGAALVFIAWAAAPGPAPAQTAPKQEEVTVYTAQKILTMERSNPEATAVAVRGKLILAAGSLSEVRSALGDGSYRIDNRFEGKVILPGLIDQHVHPLLGALTLATEVIATEDWVLPDRTFKAATSHEDYIERLRKAAREGDPKEWFFSWGYHKLWHGELNRRMLDDLSEDRPIVIWQRSTHEFYLNSKAIGELHLRKEDMTGNAYNWDEGHWWESGMNLIIVPLLDKLASEDRITRGLKQMVAYLHQNGVTAFNEPGALITPSEKNWTYFKEILGHEDTPFYSYFMPDARAQVDRKVAITKAIADAEEQVKGAPDGKVSFFPKQVKLYSDGAIISQLMQMKDGYTDKHPGEWLMEPEILKERARLFWEAGYQLHIHVNGDAALDEVLDTLEGLMREHPRADHRTVIIHFANSTEQQIGRIARLGALVSANPYYPIGFADKYEANLGERADRMVRSASVLERHIPLSLHSDLPMAPSAPLFLAWAAVNRTTPSERVAGPEQRIGVEDALRAITIEAAWSWRKENELGSIAPGKIANFTVLEKDPLAVEPKDLKDVPIWGTVFEGRLFPLPIRKPAGTSQATE